jgi:hypothetical protein
MPKVSFIHHEFVQEKQIVSDKFYKEVIERFHLSFRKVGPVNFCTTMHRRISSSVVSEFLAKRGIPVLSQPPNCPDLVPADFFSLSQIKNCDERGLFIGPTDCDERTEGDTGRSVFSGTRFVV